MAITVLKNNAPWGPFSREQVEERLQKGDFTLKYLAHAPGLKEWLPLGEVLHFLDIGAAPPPLPSRPDLPPVPNSSTLPPSHPPTFPVQPPPFEPMTKSSAAREVPSAVQEANLPPAPFVPRLFAFILDCAFLFLPVVAIFALNALGVFISSWWNQTDPETLRQQWALWHRNFTHLLWLVAIGLGWLYAAGLESSRWQATMGKRWMGLHVTDAHGERLDFLQASGRHFAKYLSGLICFIGFILALFNARGLALHDYLAKTRVTKK